jgi:hypothetical protein
MYELDPENVPAKRKLIPKRWMRRKTIHVITEEERARQKTAGPKIAKRLRELYALRTPEQRAATSAAKSVGISRYWAKASQVHRRRPRKSTNTDKVAEAAKKRWDVMSEEDREAVTTNISKGMKQKWAQRTQAQKDAISAKRSQTRMKNKMARLKAIQEEEVVPKAPPMKLTPSERSIINARSALELKMAEFKYLLNNLEDPDIAYRMFWSSLTLLQKKRIIRIAINAYKKGHHVTNNALQ